MTNTTPLPLIQLIGNSEENFYQLGLKDREQANILYHHVKSLISTPWPMVNKTINQLAQEIIPKIIPLNSSFNTKIKAYAEGLKRPSNEIAYQILIPELLSIMNQWVPGIPSTLLGCSSYFTLDHKTRLPIHGRILDFPLKGSFDFLERSIYTKLDSGPAILGHGSIGMPYPSITAMSEYGVTLALHQKFDNQFYNNGIPIFELAFQLLQNCKNLDDVLHFLKRNPSLTTWGINLSFADNQAAEVEISGKEINYKKYELQENKIIYICNKLIKNADNANDMLPFGISNFNEMRESIAKKKIKRLEKKGNITSKKLIKALGILEETSLKCLNKYQIDPLTPATIQTTILSPTQNFSYFLPGESPKFFNGEIIKSIGILDNKINQSLIKLKGKTTSIDIQNAHQSLMATQVAFDLKDEHKVYHEIQKSIIHYAQRPEGKIAEFYFYVFQYIFEKKNKQRTQLLLNFKKLEGSLPEYMNDHCLIFIARLEKILKGSTSISIDEIYNIQLQKIFDFECKMPNLLFHKITSQFTIPRIEILDIIYTHVR